MIPQDILDIIGRALRTAWEENTLTDSEMDAAVTWLLTTHNEGKTGGHG